MRTLRFLALFTVLVFIFPVMALSGQDEALVSSESGTAEISEAEAIAPELLKDERVVALEKQYSAELQALWQEIQSEPDPSERERLQKEAEALKAKLEIAITELSLEIAIERGDEERAMKIQEALDQLYWPKVAEPSYQEPRQLPRSMSKSTETPPKDLDDL